MMVLRLAFRNLVRNRWRTVLTAGGIAVAVGLLIWLSAWMSAMVGTMVASATEAGTGHVLVEPATGEDARTLHDAFDIDDEKLSAVYAHPAVSRAAPRAESFGLLGDEERSQVVRLVGVDPEREDTSSAFARGVDSGSWLAPEAAADGEPRPIVLGYGLARLLQVEPGDELVVFTQAADGSLGNDLMVVRGTTRVGQSIVDRRSAFLHIDDARWLMALEGRAHQLIVTTPNVHAVQQNVDAVAAHIGEALGGADVHRVHDERSQEGIVVQSWGEVSPALAETVEMVDGVAWVMFIMVFFLAGFGVINTQRMSVLERRREFGVLLAVGMRPRFLAKMIAAETVMLSVFGALLGLALGVGVTLYFGRFGLDPTFFTTYDGDIEVLGVQLGEPFYTRVEEADVWTPVIVMGLLSVAFALPAALRAMRLDAVRAISGRS